MGEPGRPLTPEYKKAIVAVKAYFDRIKAEPEEEKIPSVQRTAAALSIGEATVKRVMAEFNRESGALDKDPLPRGRPRRVLPEVAQTLTRDFVRNANKEGRHITVDEVCTYLNNHNFIDSDLLISSRTLNRALDRWGFTFGKGTRSAHLKEKDSVIAARQRYLRRKISNRLNSGVFQSEIYLDESYVNKNHSNDYVWYSDSDGPWIQKPTGKGERIIILNAISRDGWVPNAKLTFRSKKKTGDYHGQMNHDIFCKWFSDRLIPNIPNNSLIIMDNAPYHNSLAANSPPNISSKKTEIKVWLEQYGIPIKDNCLKAELIEILQKIGPKPIYAIDEIAAKFGHEVLRTPPYHPELQPIETCWAVVKNHFGRRCDFTAAGMLRELEAGFTKVTAKTCSRLINKIRKIEDSYWLDDRLLDD